MVNRCLKFVKSLKCESILKILHILIVILVLGPAITEKRPTVRSTKQNNVANTM